MGCPSMGLTKLYNVSNILIHTFQQYSSGIYGVVLVLLLLWLLLLLLLLLVPLLLTPQFRAKNITNNCSVHCNPSTANGRNESLILVLYRSALAKIRRTSKTKASNFLYMPFSNLDCTVDKSIGYLIFDL